MVKKTTGQSFDENLFRQEMDNVVPLKTPQTTDSRAPRKPTLRPKPNIEFSDSDKIHLSSADDQTHIDTDEGSSHRKNGVRKKTMQKLKRGQFPVGDQLDLHHMTTVTAQAVLLEFIADSQRRTLDCIRIIHGKGLRSDRLPKLKLMTLQLLREHPQVLAFTACKPAEGGAGATDVLLKSL